MNSVRRPRLLLFLLVGCSISAYPQARDPIIALRELLTADNITDAARHYPVSVEEAVGNLQGDDREEAAKVLLIRRKLGGNVAFKLSSDSGQLESAETTEHHRLTVTVISSFVSGVDALIVAQLTFSHGARAKKILSLRLEAGEWRLRSVGDSSDEENFDSDGFLQKLLPTGRNEIAALETLGNIDSALSQYIYTYPARGLPSSLAALSGPPSSPPPEVIEKPDVPEHEPDTGNQTDDSEQSTADSSTPPIAPEHAYLLDSNFMKDPVIKDGYVFRYKLIDPGVVKNEDAEYQITATPVQFGKTGTRSYFVDQTSVVRFTTENRDANENDEPVNEEHNVGEFAVRGRRIIR